uniref:CBM20 domain-containing protein n=1 Tax=Chromera velia CCMP2878 TaxID=1169474 RepID=A0A0G4I7E3_9ALVE|eukprot:Cvel_11649.t1-p1 / transcript=Cvel_11649.t1 / gene=Cvel_11649 / organism=Chromera_velia_CCMP2878 / gene_product=Glucoamylase, putative / transcript_product=Glucoamylase, putative / location=Cvel_scaffold738:27179-28879(-) / protein_length=314 / sequence_SO=supercontig / SO=protein_coding / is_pseudo=false
MTTVHFAVECSSTTLGDTLAVVGSESEIGGWSPESAVTLETDADSWPLWKGKVHFSETEAGDRMEYKYIIRRADGGVVWESFDNNRCLTLPYKNVHEHVPPLPLLEMETQQFDVLESPACATETAGTGGDGAAMPSTEKETGKTKEQPEPEAEKEEAGTMPHTPEHPAGTPRTQEEEVQKKEEEKKKPPVEEPTKPIEREKAAAKEEPAPAVPPSVVKKPISKNGSPSPSPAARSPVQTNPPKTKSPPAPTGPRTVSGPQKQPPQAPAGRPAYAVHRPAPPSTNGNGNGRGRPAPTGQAPAPAPGQGRRQPHKG